ncbi:MAG: lactate utilization protein [Patescibacteria group bacterium]
MNYNKLASQEILDATVKALVEKGFEVFVVKNGAEALKKIKELIPKGVSVMNGSSRTLEQIGYIDYLESGGHGWVNPKDAILAEKDPAKQAFLRRQAVLSDYYLGSVHALAENGEFVIGSNTGSQLPHVVFSSPNLIFVVSTKKIIPTLTGAMKRLEEHVVPLEDEHMRQLYKMGTKLNTVVIFKGESKFNGRTIRMILVKEDLGF